MAPVLVIRREFNIGQVAGDASHGDGARPVGGAKVEVEAIVLDVLVACLVLFLGQVNGQTVVFFLLFLPPPLFFCLDNGIDHGYT